MRVAFITYEYPPDIAKGGIATYVEQVARLLYKRGNDVEIFCGSHYRTGTEEIKGILIHRCKTDNVIDFRKDCLLKFTERHKEMPFDLMESPEINANALLIKEAFPSLPLVVKLHMATFIQTRLQNYYTTRLTKLRYFLGGLKRGRINFFGAYNNRSDVEYKFTLLAEGIVAPSLAQKKIIVEEWHLTSESICVIPNPFCPPEELLSIPVNARVDNIITFIGKLNVPKGIVNLIKAIPLVVKEYPDVIFRFIGTDSYFAVKKMNMSAFMLNELKGYESNYELLNGLEYNDVLKQLQTTAVCIFPSLWECFGLVCLEAMSAGRAVIGSKNGGMSEILDGGAGMITDPDNVKQMVESITTLLNNENMRWRFGKAARQKVLSHYNQEVIGRQMEAHYHAVIEKVKQSAAKNE